jgi:hypothetical protein
MPMLLVFDCFLKELKMDSNECVALTGEQIAFFRKQTLLKALWMELQGMKRRGRSVYSIVKEEFDLKGSRQSVHDQLERIVQEEKNAGKTIILRETK